MRLLLVGWLVMLGAIAACTVDGPCQQGTFLFSCDCGRSYGTVCADSAFEAKQLATSECEEDDATCACECEPIGTECFGDRCKGSLTNSDP
jgi:hypothetical protein